ncbi:MAG: M23 family metallopeptidase [Spirochaetaceae bacterium]|jgi:murein DD-endopeptidase MepM/ murein hydrolase activator NlpD|nr:M23 family metallopeptidase [Spirochaetaceae bacterium]
MPKSEYFYTNTALRLLLIFSLVSVAEALGILSSFPFQFKIPFAYQKSSVDVEAGMGGISYYETSVLANAGGAMAEEPQVVDGPFEGAPEPAEYSQPQMLSYSAYTVSSGDTIGEIVRNFGLNQDTLISLNGIKNSRMLSIGQVLRIPNQDGILYTVKTGDSLGAVAEKYQADSKDIQRVNELFSEQINVGSSLFIPGAQLEQAALQEINGELFIWPVRGYITSPYGYRSSPFSPGNRQFHTGLDIGSPMGTPIRAAMSGRVSAAGYNDITGNYVVITHHSGYRTLYGHMSVIRVKTGAYVKSGERIGDVGNSGLSTGPHLHFTVYKNGITVNPRTLMN